MKSIRTLVFTCCILLSASASFSQTALELQETARSFMQQGDFSNAGLVLSRATALAPNNLDITKDLTLNYTLQKEYKKALEVIKPVLDREDADDQCFKLAGNIYYQLGEPKDCEKTYRKGIKKFPNSGLLLNELGELLWAQRNYDAIKLWEKSIEVDPNFTTSYYNAAKYYYFTTDKVWAIVYGETFINMEPLNTHTPEIKTILLESYKKLFINTDYSKENKEKNKFTDAFLQIIKKQNVLATSGLNPESLTMIRTRFILDWFNNYETVFPIKLFELQRQLLQEGMFDAYNQWIFGIAQNLASYQTWTHTHSTEYSEFSHFQKGRIYKIPEGQYYKENK